MDIEKLILQAQVGTPQQVNLIEDHMEEFFKRFPSYEKKFTGLEWYMLFLDFTDKIDFGFSEDDIRNAIDFGHNLSDLDVIDKEDGLNKYFAERNDYIRRLKLKK